MKKRTGILSLILVGVTALVLGVAAPQSKGRGHRGHDNDRDEIEIPFSEASVFFELNNTDGDLGIHSSIDGQGWKKLEMEAPNGRDLLQIRVKGRLRRQGLTQLFFESAEPTFDELAPETFFLRFPEGDYEIEAETLDGHEMESTAELTHLLPAPPDNLLVSGMAAAEDCDEDPIPSVGAGESVIISWDPVTESHPELGRTGEPVEIVKYQVVVEREEPTLLIFSIDLPPSVTEIEVPSGFIALGDEFKFEILVREASGNQTAIESCFVVE